MDAVSRCCPQTHQTTELAVLEVGGIRLLVTFKERPSAEPLTKVVQMEDEYRVSAEHIGQPECLQLLQTKSKIGRVAFVVDGKPMVLPVNYRAEEDSVVICIGEGVMLDHLTGHAPAAFEVDVYTVGSRSGWSVLVQGRAEEVTDAKELQELQYSPLKSWVTSPSGHWIRISIDEISGRRIPEA